MHQRLEEVLHTRSWGLHNHMLGLEHHNLVVVVEAGNLVANQSYWRVARMGWRQVLAPMLVACRHSELVEERLLLEVDILHQLEDEAPLSRLEPAPLVLLFSMQA